MASFIYTWHERELHAIKIGSSSDPPLRMLNYSVAMHLMPRPASLRSVKLAHGTNPKQVLVACHNVMKQLKLPHAAELTELYRLNQRDYDEVSNMVLRAALLAEMQLREVSNDNGDHLVDSN